MPSFSTVEHLWKAARLVSRSCRRPRPGSSDSNGTQTSSGRGAATCWRKMGQIHGKCALAAQWPAHPAARAPEAPIRSRYTPRTRAIRLSLLLPFLTTDYVSPCQDIWTCNASVTGKQFTQAADSPLTEPPHSAAAGGNLGRGAISSSRENSDSECWRLPFPASLTLVITCLCQRSWKCSFSLRWPQQRSCYL